jgi:murein DD-endopeptidase MepM/ murein hydrolase activator NlpD
MRASGYNSPTISLNYSTSVIQPQTAALSVNTAPPASPQNSTTTTTTTTTGTTTTQTSPAQTTNSSAPKPFELAGLADRSEEEARVLTARVSTAALMPASLVDPDDEDDRPAVPASACDTSHSDKYCVYDIQEEDTLSSVAAKFGITGNPEEGITPWEILVQSNKPDIIDESDMLQPSQKIRIPLHNGVIHTVLSDETLTDISDDFGVSIEDLKSVNRLADIDSLAIGLELLVPNPTRFAPLVVAQAPVEEPSSSSSSSASSSSSGSGGSSSGSSSGSSGGSTIVGGGARSGSGFIWPVSGPLSSRFGPGHPLGIDIDLFNNRGAAIAAAKAGTVTFAGGNPCCSYGFYVVVDHGDGFRTLYAHFSSISVSVGQQVAQGQMLGSGGRTGYATGDHLHFEIHLNGSVVNPSNYLP